MISVAESHEELLKGFSSDKEFYLALKGYIGKVVSIRRKVVERTGTLEQVQYDRTYDEVRFRLGSGDFKEINRFHRVEILLDGIWKVLNIGHEDNLEL